LLNGLHTGALLFVSAVDARLLQALCDRKQDEVIKAIFAIWWPAGRDLMAPLGVASTIAHALAYRDTGEMKWGIAGALVFSTIAWTLTIMGESIRALRDSKSEGTFETTKKFCFLHHFRLVASAAGFLLVLFQK
jgi:hypothetical protein